MAKRPMLLLVVLVAAIMAGACATTSAPAPSPAGPPTSMLDGLRFDAEGVNFTGWVNDFKDEVYRNWKRHASVPPGHTVRVKLEFVVDRTGQLTDLRVVRSAGDPTLDQEAIRSLRESQFPSLPPEFPKQAVTMWLSFVYVGDVNRPGASSKGEPTPSERSAARVE